MNRTEAATEIKAATTLTGLLRALNQFEATVNREEEDMDNAMSAAGLDICELPTFGGPVPDSTEGVWSWDEDSLLVGEGPFAEWSIVERKA